MSQREVPASSRIEGHRPIAGAAIDRSSHFRRLCNWLPQRPVSFLSQWWSIFSNRRVSGLAAEAGFWVVFSLPWLLLALVSALGAVSRFGGPQTYEQVQAAITEAVNRVLTPEAAASYAQPVLNEIFATNQTNLSIIGIVLALWSGSRAVMTYVDAVSIINGDFAQRGYLRTRVLSIAMYIVGIVITGVTLPVVIISPRTVGDWLGLPSWTVTVGILGLAALVIVVILTSLFYRASVNRERWIEALPGSIISVVGCGLAAVGLSIYVRRLFQASSIYGVLATPIAVMAFAYVLSMVALAGAVINAVILSRREASDRREASVGP